MNERKRYRPPRLVPAQAGRKLGRESSPPADPALRQILERRLERSDVDGELDTLIAPTAIEELQVLYHDRNRDMRSVLKVAHDSARHAVDRGAEMIEPRDVRAVVARNAR